MEVNRCFKCMKEYSGEGVCPHCGFDLKNYISEVYQLQLGTVLAGKYLLGTVLGEGGFGISYVGWDLNLDQKVAIKEYYPRNFVTRQATYSPTVTALTGNNTEVYRKGQEQFVNEAKRLARFDRMPGIVYVKDFFQENGTAYMVMEFAEGKTLKQRLAENGGRLPVDMVFEMMDPVMQSLEEVHRQGMIHRDISPDNMIVDNKSRVKLLDFGAARDYLSDKERSLSVILKPGFTPEEQYRSRGEQGPWTDVYALCATIYRAVTGVTPLESLDRMNEDTLKRPSELGITMNPVWENALMKGLAIRQQDRFQSMQELRNAFHGALGMESHTVSKEKVVKDGKRSSGQTFQKENEGKISGSRKKMAVIGAGAVAAIALILVIIFFAGGSVDYEYQTDDQGILLGRYTGKETSVEIPDTIKGKSVISLTGTFSSNDELTDVVVPDGVTEIGEDTFKDCGKLKKVILPDSLVTIGKGAFQGCSGLTEITIPDHVTTIDKNAFQGCSGLDAVAVPGKVAEIGEGAFDACTGLKKLRISDGTAQIGEDAFLGCESLTDLTVPDSVTVIRRGAFENCSALASLQLPENAITIESSAFAGCTALTKMSFLAAMTENIDVNAFDGSTTVEVTDYRYTMQGEEVFLESYLGNSSDVVLPAKLFGKTVTKIEDYAFNSKKSVRAVTISQGVTEIGKSAFGSSGLESIEIPDPVTAIGEWAFSDCKDLSDVKISGSVKEIGSYAFHGCSGLKNIQLSNGITTIGQSAFWDCTSLTKVEMPDSITSMGESAFWNCNHMKEVVFPANIKIIPKFAFDKCQSLTSVTIPDHVEEIGSLAFYSCTKLKKAYVPKNCDITGAFDGQVTIVRK